MTLAPDSLIAACAPSGPARLRPGSTLILTRRGNRTGPERCRTRADAGGPGQHRVPPLLIRAILAVLPAKRASAGPCTRFMGPRRAETAKTC
jgi:hypothetical protein